MTDDERFGSARGPAGKPRKYEWCKKPDLTVKPEEELRACREKLSKKEQRALSHCQRILQDRSDLTRADLVLRSRVALPSEGLARVLLGEGCYGGGVS